MSSPETPDGITVHVGPESMAFTTGGRGWLSSTVYIEDIFDTFMTASMKEDYAMTESGEVIVTLDGGKFEVIEDG